MNPESDEALAVRAGRGDRAAFDEIVRRHKVALYRFIRRYIGHHDDSYDVLQETFIAAWMASGRYDGSRPFLPWLRTIGLNKCRDFARRQTVRRLLLRARAAEPQDTLENPLLPSDDVRETQRLNRLDAAIAELPAFYKEPLLLASVSGLSHQETAEILKTTPKAVEMRIYRAKRKLEEIMGPDLPEG